MNGTDDHWLRRPQTIRNLWIGGLVVLALLVVIGALIDQHPHFHLDGLFAFHAWFGFGSCVAMVIFAKLLGIVLKRRDTYYDHD